MAKKSAERRLGWNWWVKLAIAAATFGAATLRFTNSEHKPPGELYVHVICQPAVMDHEGNTRKSPL